MSQAWYLLDEDILKTRSVTHVMDAEILEIIDDTVYWRLEEMYIIRL